MEERRDQRNRGQQGQSGLRQQQQQQQQGQGSGRQPQQGGQWQSPDQAGQHSRQQQQFDPQGSQQPSGGGGQSRFAEQIRPHMEVIDDAGTRVGTVDHMDGDRIKLTRESSPDGEHHYLPLSLVAGIEGGRIRLRGRGDTSFGMEADR